MGVYDVYGKRGIQLKIGDTAKMRCFNVGDAVPIANGVYIGYEGIVVVKDGIFIAEFPFLRSKWGDYIDFYSILKRLNPMFRSFRDEIKKLKKKKK